MNRKKRGKKTVKHKGKKTSKKDALCQTRYYMTTSEYAMVLTAQFTTIFDHKFNVIHS